MRLAAIFLMAFPAGAAAFLFGGVSDEKAEETLRGMEAGFSAGDCRAVAGASEELFGEKPSSAIRAEAYSYLGRCYESQEMPDKAITVYKLAHGLYPDNGFFTGRLAAIYLKAGFYGMAAPLFEQVLKERFDDIEANAGLARCYAALGYLERAKSYYSRAAILGGFGDAALLKEYAARMLRKRDWEEAELAAGYALKLDPGDAGPHELLARASAGRGNYKEAAALMRRAAGLSPSDGPLALELALAELLAGNSEAALASVSVRGLDDNPLALVIRGLALRKKGERVPALEYFRKAAALPGQPFVSAFAAELAKDGG
jgi:tetratricopeptide (TPR) repeat protein